jgi:hypothetical protein
VSCCPFDFPTSLLNDARISDVRDSGPGGTAEFRTAEITADIICTRRYTNPSGFVHQREYQILHLSVETQEKLTKLKVKVKLSLCFTKHHAMKAYWGVEV